MFRHFRETYYQKGIIVSDLELKKIFKIFTNAYVFELFVPRENLPELKNLQYHNFPDLISRNLHQCSVFKVIKDNKIYSQNINDENKENEYENECSLIDINKTLDDPTSIVAMKRKDDYTLCKENGEKLKERFIQNSSLYDTEAFTDIKVHSQPYKGYRYLIQQFNELDFY